MLLTLGRGLSPVASGFKDISLQAVVPSCVFDLDATLAKSAKTGDMFWRNLVPKPADGQASGAYDFMFGNGVSEGAFPIFTGDANDKAAYLALNGGNYFTIKANTPFTAGVQRTDIADNGFSFFMALRYVDGDASLVTPIGTSPNTSATGFRLLIIKDQGHALRLYQRGDTANTSSGLGVYLTPNTDYIIGFSRASNDSVTQIWCNSLTATSVSHIQNACATDTANPLQIGANGVNGGRFADGTRIYAASMFKGTITDAQAALIIGQYQKRHGRSYI